MSKPFLSIIVPCFQEHASIAEMIENLKQTTPGAEIIIVDSSPGDETFTIINSMTHDDNLLSYYKAIGDGKRNSNMNEGAAVATGEVLLFHHADSRLPEGTEEILKRIDRNTTPYGGFIRTLTPQVPATRLADWFGRIFIRWNGFFLGDNSIFMTKAYFKMLGGYWEKPLFEDVDLMQRARKGLQSGQTRKIIHQKVVSSSRKFTKHGGWKMFFLMLRLEIRFYLGGDVNKMEKEYKKYG